MRELPPGSGSADTVHPLPADALGTPATERAGTHPGIEVALAVQYSVGATPGSRATSACREPFDVTLTWRVLVW